MRKWKQMSPYSTARKEKTTMTIVPHTPWAYSLSVFALLTKAIQRPTIRLLRSAVLVIGHHVKWVFFNNPSNHSLVDLNPPNRPIHFCLPVSSSLTGDLCFSPPAAQISNLGSESKFLGVCLVCPAPSRQDRLGKARNQGFVAAAVVLRHRGLLHCLPRGEVANGEILLPMWDGWLG